MLAVTRCTSLFLTLVVGLLFACGGDDDGSSDGDNGGGDDGGLPDLPDADPSCVAAPTPTRVPAASGLDLPIFLTAPAGDDRLFVIEQKFGIRVIDASGELLATPFLDLSDIVQFQSGEDPGVLGLAFHPDYEQNGRFFVTYTQQKGGSSSEDLVLSEFAVSDDPDLANPDPVGDPIFFALSTARGHYGGQIGFGPDGMLYVASGDMDAVTGNNESGSAQDLGNLAGKILRIDVGAAPGDYSVPDDNPFASQGGARGEVFAYGLRVPWRWSFDSMTGDFFVADVGNHRVEEVNVRASGELAGTNFGWPIVEGTLCVENGCDAEGVQPVYAYDHEDGAPAAIIGGVVYRGSAMPCLGGRYFFADHETGMVKSFALNASGQAAGLEEYPDLRSSLVTSFGTDGHGEMYILELEGDVFRVAPQ
jgi:glucose/arabinose dehydrogenase